MTNIEDTAKDWASYESSWHQEDSLEYKEYHEIIKDLTGAEVLFYRYDDGYNAEALIIYKKDGVTYSTSGSHCSCYGLEGQWEPIELTEVEAKHFLRKSSWGFWYECREEISKALGISLENNND